jgi:hypothetical protein
MARGSEYPGYGTLLKSAPLRLWPWRETQEADRNLRLFWPMFGTTRITILSVIYLRAFI